MSKNDVTRSSIEERFEEWRAPGASAREQTGMANDAGISATSSLCTNTGRL